MASHGLTRTISTVIREYLIERLRAEHGEPCSDGISQWWIDHNVSGGYAAGDVQGHVENHVGAHVGRLHICLSAIWGSDAAEVFIFDPHRSDGRSVIEARVRSIIEADALCEHIRRIVNRERCALAPTAPR